MKALSILLKSSWQKLFIGAIASAASAGLYALGIRELNEMITGQVPNGVGFLRMLLMIFVSVCLSISAGFFLTRLYEGIVADIRETLARKILMADFEVIEKNSYRILPIIDTDVNVIGRFAKSIPEILVAFFKVIAIFTYMCILSYQLTLSLLLVFVAVFLMSWVFIRKLLFEERLIRLHRNMLYKHLIGLVNGVKELSLNAMHRTGYVNKTIAQSNRSFAHHMALVGSMDITVVKIVELLVIIGLGTIILIFQKHEIYSNDLFLEFLALVLFLSPSLIVVITFFKRLKRFDVSMEQINSLSLEFDTSHVSIHQVPLNYESGSQNALIHLSKIEYEYKNAFEHAYQLGPIELEIIENEILIIKGGNGSGKTTLSKLICGLYQSKVGEVNFQSQKVTRNNLYEYRDLFAAVFADSHVFDDLRYLALDANDPRISYYSQLLGVDDKMVVKDSQISTVDLSFGQRGRLNLLRALLEDKPIYLFDEWAANQDPYFKSKFYTEILPMLKASGKTVIVISHDDQYYHVADRILTLSGGQVERIDVKPG